MLLVSNTGSGTGPINSITLGGSSPAVFQIVNQPPLPLSISPTQQTRFGIRFSPLEQQNFSATLVLNLNGQTFTLESHGAGYRATIYLHHLQLIWYNQPFSRRRDQHCRHCCRGRAPALPSRSRIQGPVTDKSQLSQSPAKASPLPIHRPSRSRCAQRRPNLHGQLCACAT